MIEISTDPISRYVSIHYDVPAHAPPEVEVRLEVQDSGVWRSAAVWKHMSETAMVLADSSDWQRGIQEGVVTERRAGGLRRTLHWNPFLAGYSAGAGQAQLKLTISGDGDVLLCEQAVVDVDQLGVTLLNDWRKVFQSDEVTEDPSEESCWLFSRTSQGSSLEVPAKGKALPQLTYPLDLKGWYAIYVLLPPKLGAIELRLTGDERHQSFSSDGSRPGMEVLWRWVDMSRQHLVIGQPYRTVYEFEEHYRAHLSHVRLVALNDQQVQELEERYMPTGRRSELIGYNEPYSWAFYENVQTNLQHWEPLLGFGEAEVDELDIQFARGGSNSQNESRINSQLLGDTHGDPVRGKVPKTSNVGRMQQYTNMLATQLKYANMLGIRPRANLGASNCYPGTGLESDFSKEHPEWRDGSTLRYDIPEVRAFVISLLKEAVEIGAKAVSVDWCRYPHSIRDAETVNIFFRELRGALGPSVSILTRFPGRGVVKWEYMDYATWAREGTVDILCPSGIQGRHMHIDIGEYLEAVRGTGARVYPNLEGLGWGLTIPGMWFQRAQSCYEQGADGLYVYQCDAPVLSSASSRRWLRFTAYPDSIRDWLKDERGRQGEYSTDVYIQSPLRGEAFPPHQRLRVWVEGSKATRVQLLVDGELINDYAEPPYVLGSEENEDDHRFGSGEHTLTVKMDLGSDAWLERDFTVSFT